MSFLNAASEFAGQIQSKVQSVISKLLWKPHEYQITAIKMLLSQGSVGLFLDPGLGKTSTCLAAFKILKTKKYAAKMLIVAPLRPAYKVWPDEVTKWQDFTDLTFVILHGPKKAERLKADVDIYIINPEGLSWLFDQKTVRPQFDVLCIDESSKFKNSQTQRFKLLKPFMPGFARRWILTGTPVPNGLMDLFGQIYILDLGAALGRYITHYRREFFDQGGYGGYEYTPKHDAFPKIVERIKPLVLQMSAKDYISMPELVSTIISVDLPPDAMRVYKEVEDGFFSAMEGGAIVAGNAAVAGGKCRQIANGAVYYKPEDWDGKDIPFTELHDAKLDALEDLIEELGGKPVLVLYEFDHDKRRIASRFPTARVLGSGVSQKEMERTIDDFNAGHLPILLGHPASMGHGLNLQKSCHHVIWFGITWNLDFYIQANARIYRQGQQGGSVFIYHLVAAKTLDERVAKVLTQKDSNQTKLLTALGGK